MGTFSFSTNNDNLFLQQWSVVSGKLLPYRMAIEKLVFTQRNLIIWIKKMQMKAISEPIKQWTFYKITKVTLYWMLLKWSSNWHNIPSLVSSIANWHKGRKEERAPWDWGDWFWTLHSGTGGCILSKLTIFEDKNFSLRFQPN